MPGSSTFLDNLDERVRREFFLQGLPPRRPADLDMVDLRGASQTELQGERALRKVPRFPFVIFGERLTTTSMVAPRPSRFSLDLDVVDLRPPRKIADEHLRRVVEREGDDVEISVVVQVEDDR